MKTFLMFLAMIACTVVANLLLKVGAVQANEGTGLARYLSWHLASGALAFGGALGIYVLILQRLPLNVVQSFTAAQFVAVILASAWILSEPVKPGQWLGIALITVGIVVVGWSR